MFLFYLGLFYSALIGLIVGSFLNVCIDRLPLQYLSQEEKQQLLSTTTLPDILKQCLASNRLNLLYPVRSICFTCGHQLAWYENIPVVSYLWSRGRCQKCQSIYGQRSVWIEVLNGIIYGLLYSVFGLSSFLFILALSSSYALVYGGIIKEQGKVPKIVQHLGAWIICLDTGMIAIQIF
ncbi:MAG: prepilin peptidase [SAR324 cluster bacterium]|nr:prepilin peptidase [SAR324 cluster bacterium]